MRNFRLAAVLLLAALLLSGCRYVVVETEPIQIGAEATSRP